MNILKNQSRGKCLQYIYIYIFIETICIIEFHVKNCKSKCNENAVNYFNPIIILFLCILVYNFFCDLFYNILFIQ